jgi:tRNA 5-methylaminomethyl-2-thiouridine biosynthesis bifunctional protein
VTAAGGACNTFLSGNDLPQRWAGRPCFVVLQTSFGDGSDFLATWAAWRADPQACNKLVVVAISAQPPSQAQLLALVSHPAAGPAARPAARPAVHSSLAAELAQHWPPLTRNLHSLSFDAGRVQLLLAVGELATTLPGLRLWADAFFLSDDASPRLLMALGRKAATGASLVARFDTPALRQGLHSAGFQLQTATPNAPTPAPPVSHLCAHFAPRFSPRTFLGRGGDRGPAQASARPATRPKTAVVVGAGLAGAAVARALAERGLQVTVLDRHPTPASEASGNPAGLFHGTVHGADGSHTRLHRAAALHAQRCYAHAVAQGVAGEVRGLLRLQTLAAAAETQRMQALLHRLALPSDYVRALGAAEASQLAGVPLSVPAWFYPGGGWVSPAAWVQHALSHTGVRFVGAANVQFLVPNLTFDETFSESSKPTEASNGQRWQVRDGAGQLLAQADLVVLANAASCASLLAPLGHAAWPLSATRGQLTHWPAGATAAAAGPHRLKLPLTGDGYAIPMADGGLLCGATREAVELTTDMILASSVGTRDADNQVNVQRLQSLTGCQAPDPSTWQARAGLRVHTPDGLPIAGAVPLPTFAVGQRLDQARLLPRQRGLFVLTALGARGLTWAPLLADLIAAQALGEPWPLEQDLADAIDPARWVVRAARAANNPG